MAASSWYRTKAWWNLRRQAFVRDGFRCRFCGKQCRGNGKTDPEGAICDHVKPHRGDEALFFDLGNLQTLCKRCHDRHKQRTERNGFDRVIGDDGWPLDPKHPANRKP